MCIICRRLIIFITATSNNANSNTLSSSSMEGDQPWIEQRSDMNLIIDLSHGTALYSHKIPRAHHQLIFCLMIGSSGRAAYKLVNRHS